MPKTIDNDLDATDVTFGFDTALHVATEAIDRLHTTAGAIAAISSWRYRPQRRVIALHSGLAGGADVILIPEMPFDIDEVCRLINRRHARGRYCRRGGRGATPKEGTMTVATGQVDEFGHPRLGG